MLGPTRSPGYAALRRGRCSLAGQVYLLTTTTQRRQLVFLDTELARVTARLVDDVRLWRDSRLLCWVLMPDHWHGVLELGGDEPLAEVMRRFKAVSGGAVNRTRRSNSAVWAAGFHDHALRFEEDLIGVARYVVANPIRAGLVTRAGDYPYWNAVWL
jgi:REP element-mobilizing transposase RayT